MALFFVGMCGFLVCFVMLVVKAIRKKPKKVTAILTVLFLVIGFAGMIHAMNNPSIDPLTENPPVDSPTNPAKTGKDDSKIKTEITEGEVFEKVLSVWRDVNIVEVYDKSVGSTLTRINIYTNEVTPLDNARKYFDVVLGIRNNCSDSFRKADYNRVVLHFNVTGYDGNLYFYTELAPKGNTYHIDGFASKDIISLSSAEYIEAIQIALSELD